jgi:hypothetical protein
MAETWNSFNAFAKQWAEEVNSTPVGGISARAMTLAREMDDLYGSWKKKRKRWEEGV